jgi:hypothetical protein
MPFYHLVAVAVSKWFGVFAWVNQWEHLPEFPKFRAEPVISERIFAESSGAPIEVSRKGKTPPLERGRGKAFPFLSNPIGSLRRHFERRNNWFPLTQFKFRGKINGFTKDD